MPDPVTRELDSSEEVVIADVLRRLREHFHEWQGREGGEHNLVGFAFYEGCGGSEHCGALLAEAAPFALGQELVLRHGFRWVMLAAGAGWRYGVTHPALAGPVDLVSLEDGAWNDGEYDEPPDPGRVTHESLEALVAHVSGNGP